jgi:hypothetical protein
MEHVRRELTLSRGRYGYIAKYRWLPKEDVVMILAVRHQREEVLHVAIELTIADPALNRLRADPSHPVTGPPTAMSDSKYYHLRRIYTIDCVEWKPTEASFAQVGTTYTGIGFWS